MSLACVSTRAFSFVEVTVALVILSISLVVLLEGQGNSMDLVSRARQLDKAVTLAVSKMAELTYEAERKGITALKEEESGEFGEAYDGYRWRYTVTPVPAPDFAKMASLVMGSDEADESRGGNAALFEGPLAMVGRAWGEALKELKVEVTYGSERRPRSYVLITHLIDKGGLGQIEGLIGALTGGLGG